MENKVNLTGSVLKLMRAMRRHPIRPARPFPSAEAEGQETPPAVGGPMFPPAVGRVLMLLSNNDGASPAELCEFMDVRPSSMSELLSRMEERGLVRRVTNEEDRRATKVFLTDEGKEGAAQIENRFEENNARLAACFTEEELVQFCTLCDRLSAHVESLPGGECGPRGPHHGPHGMHGPHHGPHGFGGPHGHCPHRR